MELKRKSGAVGDCPAIEDRLLDGVGFLRERFQHLLGLIRDERVESRGDVGVGNVDVIPLGDTWRTVAHQASQQVPIHAALRGPRISTLTGPS